MLARRWSNALPLSNDSAEMVTAVIASQTNESTTRPAALNTQCVPNGEVKLVSHAMGYPCLSVSAPQLSGFLT